jgi:hypothetical protein
MLGLERVSEIDLRYGVLAQNPLVDPLLACP